jgi:hypothetical protein
MLRSCCRLHHPQLHADALHALDQLSYEGRDSTGHEPSNTVASLACQLHCNRSLCLMHLVCRGQPDLPSSRPPGWGLEAMQALSLAAIRDAEAAVEARPSSFKARAASLRKAPGSGFVTWGDLELHGVYSSQSSHSLRQSRWTIARPTPYLQWPTRQHCARRPTSGWQLR